MKVVILGKGEMLSNLIEGTLDAKHKIVGVLRYERTVMPRFLLALRDFFKSSSDVTIIKQHKLHEIKCNSANSEDFKKEILKLNADLIIVGYLQTILHRENFSGLTFHLMDENFDTGAILAQTKIKIFPGDTGKELKERTVFQARILCAELLQKLGSGLLIPVEQNEKEATYYPNIKADDMMLDFNGESAEQIHARIRAFHPWLPCYVTYKNRYFIPNPYKLRIFDEEHTETILKKNKITNPKVGDIINTNYKSRTITVMCGDWKSIKMTGVYLYGFFNKPFTKMFIKNISLSSK